MSAVYQKNLLNRWADNMDTKKKDPKYNKAKLIKNSQGVFKEQSYVVAGALVDIKNDLTIPEAKRLIKKFKKKVVN